MTASNKNTIFTILFFGFFAISLTTAFTFISKKDDRLKQESYKNIMMMAPTMIETCHLINDLKIQLKDPISESDAIRHRESLVYSMNQYQENYKAMKYSIDRSGFDIDSHPIVKGIIESPCWE